MAKKLAYIKKTEEIILRKYWPGKVTFILKRKNILPKIIFGKEKTIGLRVSKYKAVSELLRRLNKPLTGTSANISGSPSLTKIKGILKQFHDKKNKPDLVLDAGNLKPSKPSTIIDLTNGKFKIVRKGAIKFKA
jgi:L-threonylcarbamoyladenylate synthase